METVEQCVLDVINAPTQALFGWSLIGNGTDGAPGSGQAGGNGGCCGATVVTVAQVE
ncbi:PE-PGRS family domain protein [Mycobacterium ulcerans str. Harvey]|uniref:PE-PGRS family domain protein n=1 Tax=Mycobacterium ulcerans str. Harvey TaxID=1299332 RepID=A0ABP3AR91_MYCUL|nr:PE-PGRS family domain protein [Mycobacterium ulcerans str. Harvey]